MEIFRKACEAVLFAHRQAIVHRDLKPSNILVRSDAGRDGPSVKRRDNGIAKIIDDEDNGHTSTQPCLMTPACAAPEQALGKPVGVYTDVYALGALPYELLAGDRPHELSAMTPSRAERVLVQEDPEPPPGRRQRYAPHGIHPSRAECNELEGCA